ncbi:class I SAM-dependent methyltransferase [Metasolibacillus meyeri]|uniref:Class I SAM-dependent methyltransferase n=1 Tax=Metasolibacillus meyeri TaxID=1071052 RepID=A0AAW9NTL4_9BACL|nr:class I SAM-dependent methyltransferase [Metasolibacillus meyeri]MEC1179667.1 class I SAM-dependent methyltransferase [Metasolibacillus meyeri]
MNTYYGSLCSLFYDLSKPTAPTDELNFYMSYVNKDMSILEPMCGSGRFMLEFIQNGYDIDGFDISEEMITRFQEKLEGNHYNGILQRCEFSTFHPNKLYDFIFIAAGSFSLITDHEQILSYLTFLKNWLQPNGKIALTVFTNIEYRNGQPTEAVDTPRAVQQQSIEIQLTGSTSYNPINGVTHSKMTYDLFENGIKTKSENEDFYVKYYQPNEFEAFAAKAGLQIESSFIDYNKTLFAGQDSDAVVYVLTRS